jgi:hypothetical protein
MARSIQSSARPESEKHSPAPLDRADRESPSEDEFRDEIRRLGKGSIGVRQTFARQHDELKTGIAELGERVSQAESGDALWILKLFPPSLKKAEDFNVPDVVIGCLTKVWDGNVHEHKVVKATSFPPVSARPQIAARNVSDLEQTDGYSSA